MNKQIHKGTQINTNGRQQTRAGIKLQLRGMVKRHIKRTKHRNNQQEEHKQIVTKSPSQGTDPRCPGSW